jgi:tRNA(His) 5'-end guanylyltransferase
MKKESLGDRMKNNYENVWKTKLPMRMPVIIRLDGKAFHTLTKKSVKPFDPIFINVMQKTANWLCNNIQGAELAYTQSDEISILLHNYKKLESQAWFDNEIQKIVSISAGTASAFFSLAYNMHQHTQFPEKASHSTVITFDSRVFVLPENEVCNYFIWRQQDWERNSIQMLAQSLYSSKQLHKKSNTELKRMCLEKGRNWVNLDAYLRRGTCCIKENGKWELDMNLPLFTIERNYIEKRLAVEED